jgi:hypothetical protein
VVSGGVGIAGNVYINSNTDISGNLSVKSSGNVMFKSNTPSTNYSSGALVVSGGVGIAGNVYINSNTDISGNLLVKSGGNVYINSTTSSTNYSSGALVISGGVGIAGNLNCNGNINSVSFNSTSDYREKTNVKELNEVYDIFKLRPVSFNFIKTNKKSIGFIAHEVAEYFEYLVDGEKDGEVKQTLNYDGIIPILTYNVQQLKQQLDEQKQQLDEQKQQLDEQKQQISKLINH